MIIVLFIRIEVIISFFDLQDHCSCGVVNFQFQRCAPSSICLMDLPALRTILFLYGNGVTWVLAYGQRAGLRLARLALRTACESTVNNWTVQDQQQ